VSLFDETIYSDHLREVDERLAYLDRRLTQALQDLGIEVCSTWDPMTGRLSVSTWLTEGETKADEFVRRIEDLAGAHGRA
jgi:hypothetical protein